jgi:RNA polymerase sigma factor (sigma-70 family)
VPSPDEHYNDARLIDQCRRGEAAAWVKLIERYRRLVFAVPRRAGLSDDLAADVFQTVFAALHRHLERIDDPSRLQAWLVTTAKRESLRQLREQRRLVFVGDEDGADTFETLADERPLPDEVLAELQKNHQVRVAFDRLDERCRRLLAELYLADEPASYAEVAKRLDCPEGSVGPTRARCLDKLRRLLATGGNL